MDRKKFLSTSFVGDLLIVNAYYYLSEGAWFQRTVPIVRTTPMCFFVLEKAVVRKISLYAFPYQFITDKGDLCIGSLFECEILSK
jgi:hypothetical protein